MTVPGSWPAAHRSSAHTGWMHLPHLTVPPTALPTANRSGSQGRHLAVGIDAELASPEVAAAAGVSLSASRHLQDAAVGLYDSQLTRFVISDTQVGGWWRHVYSLSWFSCPA